MAMNIDFTGKTVLITGAGRGLGKEMAIQFAGCGANVYLGNRKVEQGEETVAELEAMGVRAGFTKCDVAVEEDVEKLIADAVEFGGGKLDVIVNAAGVICLQDLMYIKPEEVERLFSINVGGTVNMLKHGLKVLEGQKSGNFITVSSIAGRDGMNMLQAYSASKAAVTHYTRYLAAELGPHGMRANCISPGVMMTARVAAQAAKRTQRRTTSGCARRSTIWSPTRFWNWPDARRSASWSASAPAGRAASSTRLTA